MCQLKQLRVSYFPHRLGLLTAIVVSSLLGCGGGGNEAVETTNQSTVVSGTVAAGLAGGATVTVLPIDTASNQIGTQVVARAKTDQLGRFHLTLPQTEGNFILQVAGGSYVDEATHTLKTLNTPLLAPLVLPLAAPISVTPFTTALVHTALGQPGALNEQNLQAATLQLTSYLGFNPVATLPDFTNVATTVPPSQAGLSYTFALGVASQYGADNAQPIAKVVQAIIQEAQQGKTLYNSGGGGTQIIVNSDTTTQRVSNSQAASELNFAADGAIIPALASSVGNYALNPNNTTGIRSITAALQGTQPPTPLPQPALASTALCSDRDLIQAQFAATFNERAQGVQAKLGGQVTLDNWRSTGVLGTWGPSAVNYSAYTPPSFCTAATGWDATKWQQEFLMAVINYWVDKNLNYCHHHIPGWVPPLSLRNSSAGSTSGEGASAMTCTANRYANGSQVVAQPGHTSQCSAPEGANYCRNSSEIDSPDPAKRVQWSGYDCSNFSSWYYNFSGLTGGAIPTGIGSQACTQGVGVLLDINAFNFEQYAQYLQTGDLLYILDSPGGQSVAHVVVWSGKTWEALQTSTNASPSVYSLTALGQANNRLGGDILNYGLSAQGLSTVNPWMIVDSHYAGPAYRPFIGWYRKSLSHVRRIINANALPSALQNLVLKTYSAPNGSVSTTVNGATMSFPNIMYSNQYAALPAGKGYRLVSDLAKDACARDGNIATLP